MPIQINKPGGELTQSIRLNDGRKLGYKEYGDKDGFPILALHGTPGSRVWFEEEDPISKELGIRLITVDRPGYGISDKKKKRKISDFYQDLNQLIAQLKIDKFSIFGVSGGGAYSLAFASTNHPQLVKVGIVASAYEFINGKAPIEMCKPNRAAFYLAKRFPFLIRFTYNQQKKLLDNKPEVYLESTQKHVGHLCQSDREVLKNIKSSKAMVLHLREAFRISASEVARELKLLGNDWEIDFAKIQRRVEVWHGEEDTLSPIIGLKRFLERIPNYNPNFIKGKGHFLDEDIDIWKRILQSLKP